MKPFMGILAGCAFAGGVQASELVYTPINPTFGGNPLNASQLQAVASAQKPNAPTTKATQQSTSQQFLQRAACSNRADNTIKINWLLKINARC